MAWIVKCHALVLTLCVCASCPFPSPEVMPDQSWLWLGVGEEQWCGPERGGCALGQVQRWVSTGLHWWSGRQEALNNCIGP